MKQIVAWILPLVVASQVFAQYEKPGPRTVKTFDAEWTDASRDRAVPVRLYYPDDNKGPYPVIIFSHGLGGSREGYAYLGRHWAGHGYISVHLQHKGSDIEVWRGSSQPFQDLQHAAKNVVNAINRPKDVSFVIDQIEKLNDKEGPMRGRFDLKRVGLAGHSFGAFTTLAGIGQVLGKDHSLADARIVAAIPMSAPVPAEVRMNLDDVYRPIKVPVFHMTGTDDHSPIGETTAEQRRLPFDHGAGHPRYLLILKNANHMAFADQQFNPAGHNHQHHGWILMSSTAFWDAHLKRDPTASTWLDNFAKKLGDQGTFDVRP